MGQGLSRLANVDLLALEFNHDVDLEHSSGRSPYLIARILSEEGHLSNLQALELLREVVLVLAIVDRLQGAEQLFRDEGVTDYRAVFTVRDLGVNVDVPGSSATTPC